MLECALSPVSVMYFLSSCIFVESDVLEKDFPVTITTPDLKSL